MDPVLETIKNQVGQQLDYFKTRLKTAYFAWQKAKADTLSAKFKSENMYKLLTDFYSQIAIDFSERYRGTSAAGYYSYFTNYGYALDTLVRYYSPNQQKYLNDERVKTNMQAVVEECLDTTSPRYNNNPQFGQYLGWVDTSYMTPSGKGSLAEFLAPYGARMYELVKNRYDSNDEYNSLSQIESLRQQDVTKIRAEIDNLQSSYADYIKEYGEAIELKTSDQLLAEIKAEPQVQVVEQKVEETKAITETLSPGPAPVVNSNVAPTSAGKGVAIAAALGIGALMFLGGNK